MLIVIPVCRKDADICLQNLDWVAKLDPMPYPYTAAVSYDSDFDATAVIALAKQRFANVLVFRYPPWRGNQAWPYPQNWAWQQTARWIESGPKESWLWWEQDAVPVRKNWLKDIVAEYHKAKKPFMGHIVEYYDGHMNGVACYPHNVSAYTTDALLGRAVAFDLLLGPSIKGNVHKANHLFIHHIPPNYEPSTFYSYSDVADVVTKECALFHRCKDGSLVARLEEGPDGPGKPRPQKQSKHQPMCFHSGDYGDIIYSLLFVKQCLTKVNLVCGPEANCGTRIDMTEQRFRWVEPLLSIQPYIKTCRYSRTIPYETDYNLNLFRKMWLNWDLRAKNRIDCLFKAYPFVFGFDPVTETEPWLTVDGTNDGGFPVLVHRSTRYRNDHFPWRRVLLKYSNKMAFIGMKSEWISFCRQFSCSVPFLDVINALDMAKAIYGCKVFIGNQSLPMALSLGLGKLSVQEVSPDTPDCIFKRKSLILFRPGSDPGALPLPEI